jgi:DNA processing protein
MESQSAWSGDGCVRQYLRLHLAEGVGALTFRRLVEHFGSVEAICAAGPPALRAVEGVGPKTAAAIAAVDDRAIDEELALAQKHGVKILCRGQGGYPAALDNIHDPPAVLYVKGQLAPADAVALSVVGSRRCTTYGLEQAERFGGLAGRAGLTVVSGGARGIDAAAHRGALSAGGRTIAVMGCGLCTTYPPENARLFEQIADGRGALLSELPMRTTVLAGNFPTRNRLISGLSLGVLIVEAAWRSGSLITARVALEQGREVLAVPGRVDSPFSAGTNGLIAKGSAAMARDLDDVLAALGAVGQSLRDGGATQEAMQPAAPAVELSADEQALLACLANGELSLDELVRRAAQPAAKVTAAMTMLALKGRVRQLPGGLFAMKR